MSRVGRNREAFTIIELVVVIVIIGILAGIVTVGLNRYSTNARDTQRQAKATVIAEGLEKYYSQNGEYPGCSQLSSTANVSGSTLTGLTGPLSGVDTNTLLTPTATSSTTNSITCTDLTSVTGPDVFAYVGDGSSTCNATSGTTSCLQFTLKYKDETTGQIDSITSRHTTDIATSGAANDLAVTNTTCQTDTLQWSPVGNAIGYTAENATDPGFTNNVLDKSTSTNSYTFTGLSEGVAHYYRIKSVSASGQSGGWSNVVPSTTWKLTSPTVTIGTVGANSIAYSWSSVNHATSYSYRVATSSDFSSGIVDSGTTSSTSNTTSGLTAGVDYYIGITPTASGCNNGTEGTNDAVTTVPVPTNMTATAISTTQVNTSWDAVSGATSYSVQYSTNSSFPSYYTASGITGTSTTIGSLQQGTTWYFRVIAYVGAAYSNPSNVAGATTSIDGASGLGITAYRPGAVRAYAAGWWIAWINSPASGNWYYAYANGWASCPSGAYPVYQFEANYNSPATAYYTGATTGSQWFMAQPTSGYKIKFQDRAYCQGPSTNSGWSGWAQSCAANPGSTVSCTF